MNHKPPDDRVCTPPPPQEPEDPHIREVREKMLDKTLADTYPASDPPSSIPDPAADDSIIAEEAA